MGYRYYEFQTNSGDKLVLRVRNPKIEGDHFFGASYAPDTAAFSDDHDRMLIYGFRDQSPEYTVPFGGIWRVELGEFFIAHFGAEVVRITPGGEEFEANSYSRAEDKIR